MCAHVHAMALLLQMPASSFVEDGAPHALLEDSVEAGGAGAAPEGASIDNSTNLLDDVDEPLTMPQVSFGGMCCSCTLGWSG